jgi:hypothetical protein
MLRLNLLITGRLSVSLTFLLGILFVLAVDPIVLRVFFPAPVPGIVWLISVLIYAGLIVYVVKSRDKTVFDAKLTWKASRTAVIGIYMYSALLLLLATIIPASSFSEEYSCGPGVESCFTKSVAFEIALRLWGLLAALDCADISRWRRRTRELP